MTRLNQFIVTAFLLFTCFGCSHSANLTEDEVYAILNEIIVDDSIQINLVCSKLNSLPISDDYGFSDKDKDFIEQQKNRFKDFQFKENGLKHYSRRLKRMVGIPVDTACSSGIVNRFSFPLISIDRTRVVIENLQDCNCMLGGQGSETLYLKINGHWLHTKFFNSWISFFELPKRQPHGI